VISAFLVQMTKWETVKRILLALREEGLSTIEAISRLDEEDLARKIRAVNFYKTKATRLRAFASFVVENGGLSNLLKLEMRSELLKVNGLGEETVDSILLFAGHQPVFPASEYSRRVLSRYLGVELRRSEVPKLVSQNVTKDIYSFKILHAGLGSVGKASCLQGTPKCDRCILKQWCKSNYRYP
jgi:Uncharacterized protein related to Endonuclease III